jgi:hypothetical protein
MRDEGIEIGSELVIDGALGEELEKKWHLITALKQWETWEYKQGGHPDAVQYRDIEVLSRALTLPPGWEAHTMIDISYPLQDRVRHMMASLSYLEWRELSIMEMRCCMNVMVGALYERCGDIILPFLRNTQLKRGGLINTGYVTEIDWEALLSMIPPDGDKTAIRLAEFMLGRNVMPCLDYGIILTSNRISSLKMMITKDSLIPLYIRILRYIPEDISPSVLGMSVVIAEMPASLWSRLTIGLDVLSDDTYVAFSDLVGWINSFIITRYAHSGACVYRTIRDINDIQSYQHEGIAGELYETIGLYAMRRILVSLRTYQKNTYNEKWPHSLSEVINTDRADGFAEALEKCLEEHQGEDEGVKNLSLIY